MAVAVNARRYVIAGVCLLIAAAALRFYNLPGATLRYDEILATQIAGGSFWEVIYNTRHIHTAPILHPIALWVVQKASSTELSVRLLPAAASLLTVAALLFLMPRVGVGRWAAFIAALLAALSPAAIEHAQDAREYSIDTLVAILMIAGLLQYLRDGRKALLCGALFAGPLLQYGLVLFGAAVLGAAALAPAAALPYVRKGGLAQRIWGRVRRRIDLALPAGCFAAACAASWELTGKYRYWGEHGGSWDVQPAKAEFYYQGGYDAAAAAEFAIVRTWETLLYHMPAVVAAGAVIAFVALPALSAARRRRLDAVAAAAALAVGIAVCAALIDAYPYGGIRSGFYLGPIIFLAAGGAFHRLALDAAALARRAWVGPVLASAAAVAITVVCADAVRQYGVYLYHSDAGVKRALAALDELEREGDAVYVSRWEVPAVEFYKAERPANYFYGDAACWGPSWAECVPEMLDEMFGAAGASRRIWLIHNASVSVGEEMARHSPEVAAAEVAAADWAALRARQAGGLPRPHYDRQVERFARLSNDNSWPKPRATLHLITGFGELAAGSRQEWLAMYDAVASEAASAVSDYDVWLRADALYYAKRPCGAADTEARFFLHVYPVDTADLTKRRRPLGFEHLDFEFRAYGSLVDDRCIIRRELPEYAIERIHAGQFVPNGDVVWEVELAVNP